MFQIVLLAVLVFIPSAQAAKNSLRAEIERPEISLWDAQDPEVVMYSVSFSLRISNLGTEAVRIGSKPVFVVLIQSRNRDGLWVDLNQKSWYDDGSIKYPACSSVPPHKETRIPRLNTELSFMGKDLARIGIEPVLRFRIEILCLESDGRVETTVIQTEPTAFRLPPR